MVLIACGCAAVLAWFVGRARVGARTRAVAGAQLRTTDRLATLAGAPLGRAVAAGCVVAVLAGGWSWLPLGVPGGVAWWVTARRRDAALRRRRLDEQVPDALRAVAAALRAGAGVPLALRTAGEEMPPPIGPHLARTAARVEIGVPLEDAVAALAADAASAAVSRMAETLRVGAAAGATLPAILDEAAAAQQEWTRIARDRSAATSQARLSAIVVAAMPLAFLVLAGPAARGPARVLVHEPAGWILLATGAGLDAAGWAWMRRIGGAA